MKITFDIDCTPQEARTLMGLPDLEPLHELYLERMRGLVTDGLTPADFERLARNWMPGMADGLEKWRSVFLGTPHHGTELADVIGQIAAKGRRVANGE